MSDSEYMGRGSVLGNPRSIEGLDTRDVVCDWYEDYFADQVRTNPVFLNELKRLNNLGHREKVLRLGCFCAPRRCHVETIKRFLEENQDFLETF